MCSIGVVVDADIQQVVAEQLQELFRSLQVINKQSTGRDATCCAHHWDILVEVCNAIT